MVLVFWIERRFGGPGIESQHRLQLSQEIGPGSVPRCRILEECQIVATLEVSHAMGQPGSQAIGSRLGFQERVS
jgi:hypothetical protein